MGWLSAFRAIPWNEVIAAAPVVVQGARKLLDKVKKRETAPAAPESLAADEPLAALRARVAELQEQQAAASALVQSLAEQNEKLVAAVGVLRLRTRVLTWLCLALAATQLLVALR